MKDYRLVFAYATVLFALSAILYSITTANANPMGPNISLGSNPQFSFYAENCSSDQTIITVPSDQVLIITDIISAQSYDSDTITLKTASSTLAKFRMDFYTPAWYGGQDSSRTADQSGTFSNNGISLQNGIVVGSGETLFLSCNSNMVTITGYYTNP